MKRRKVGTAGLNCGSEEPADEAAGDPPEVLAGCGASGWHHAGWSVACFALTYTCPRVISFVSR